MPAALSFTRERSLVPSRFTLGSAVSGGCVGPRGVERRSEALAPSGQASGFAARCSRRHWRDIFSRVSYQERITRLRMFRPL